MPRTDILSPLPTRFAKRFAFQILVERLGGKVLNFCIFRKS